MPVEQYPLDEMVTVFSSSNYDAESEAEAVKGLLDSAEIESVIVRDNVPELPTGKVEVRVLERDSVEALQLIEDASEDYAADQDPDLYGDEEEEEDDDSDDDYGDEGDSDEKEDVE